MVTIPDGVECHSLFLAWPREEEAWMLHPLVPAELEDDGRRPVGKWRVAESHMSHVPLGPLEELGELLLQFSK